MDERLSPTAAKKVINAMMRERGGTLRHRSYQERGVGKTEQWNVTEKLFDFHARRLGFRGHEEVSESTKEIAETDIQPRLF